MDEQADSVDNRCNVRSNTGEILRGTQAVSSISAYLVSRWDILEGVRVAMEGKVRAIYEEDLSNRTDLWVTRDEYIPVRSTAAVPAADDLAKACSVAFVSA